MTHTKRIPPILSSIASPLIFSYLLQYLSILHWSSLNSFIFTLSLLSIIPIFSFLSCIPDAYLTFLHHLHLPSSSLSFLLKLFFPIGMDSLRYDYSLIQFLLLTKPSIPYLGTNRIRWHPFSFGLPYFLFFSLFLSLYGINKYARVYSKLRLKTNFRIENIWKNESLDLCPLSMLFSSLT